VSVRREYQSQIEIIEITPEPLNTQPAPNAIEAVKAWVRTMGKRGMYAPTSAQLRVAALTQLTSILDADEPHDPATVLANMFGAKIFQRKQFSISSMGISELSSD
jgi:hypothetical protein